MVNMAEDAFDLQNSYPKGLLLQGIDCFSDGNMKKAVHYFSKVVKLLSDVGEQDLIEDDSRDVYLYYGVALLSLLRKKESIKDHGVLTVLMKDEGNGKPKEANQEANTSSERDFTTEKREGNEIKKDLKLAWELLKKAEDVFTSRVVNHKEKLAETHFSLGEVYLDSGNFLSAIEHMLQGLEIYKTLFGKDDVRIEIGYFMLGAAYCANAQIDEAIESAYSSYESLHARFNNLKKGGIEVLKAGIEKIVEQIYEMKTLIDAIVSKIAALANEASYKLGAAYCGNARIDEATESSYSSYIYLSNKVNRLKKEEIEELNAWVSKLLQKISNLEKLIDEIEASVNETSLSTNGASEGDVASIKLINERQM